MAEIPVYQSISLDIAHRIMNKQFLEGSKLSGRSLLAAQYHVSSETIRKAIGLLKEAGIVDVSQGKEISVVSHSKAAAYIEKHNRYAEPVYSLKQDLERMLKEKKRMDLKFEETILDITKSIDRFRNLTPYNPVEVEINPTSYVIGKTIADIKLWQNTGATIIAIRRDTGILISPGPYIQLQENDCIVVVGDDNVYERTCRFVSQLPEER